MKFYPGVVSGRLKQLAAESGVAKAVVLRDLIAAAPEPDNGVFHQAYDYFAEMGLRIQKQSLAGELGNVLVLAVEVLEGTQKLPVAAETPKNFSVMSEIKTSKGSPMTFRPKDQREKLVRLSTEADLSMSTVLRGLVAGISLPSSIEKKVYALLSRTGGYIKHIAYSDKIGDWRKLAACGNAICGIALARLKQFNTRRINSEHLEDES